jgi:YegS/Rv2252/BmrU family lipid kinase
MNEIASAIAFTDTVLALVPSGSGNGLARELRVPFDASAALALAFNGREQMIDAGQIDSRLFFNVAGVGLDARVAHRFAVGGLEKRGFSRYVSITMRELAAYQPDRLAISTAASTVETSSLLVAIANGREYGNGAVIAPHARLDDGLLDLVVVAARSLVRACVELPFVFMGAIDRLSGVRMEQTDSVKIASPYPLVYHVDGEPIAGTLTISAKVRPQALRVKVPVS